MSTKQKQSKISFGGSKQPIDPTWEHCKVVNAGNKKFLTCNYCGNKYHGGVYRIKHHLAQTKNNVAMCKEVTQEVKKLFLDYIQKFENDKEKCEELGDLNGEDELGTREKLMRDALKGTKTPNTLSTYFNKPKRDDACMAICDFFYANALPFNVVNIKYFKRMLNVVGEFGKGLKPPSMHEIRVTNLKNKVEYVQGTLEAFKQEWKRTGCTLMSDGWTDKKHRSITNFLVNSPSGMFFLKSIDTSDIQHNAENLFAFLDGIIEEVGKENVVQVITDGALAYVKADIGYFPMNLDTVEKAKFLSAYIYKRSFVVNLMTKHTNGRDLIRAGATRFATNYLNLKRFHVCKVALRKMVTSDAWTKTEYAKEQVGIKVQTIILSDENFWQSVISFLKSVIPIVKVLRLVDGYDKPAMGYIYKAIDKAKEQIQANFKNVKRRYEYATDFVPNIDVKLGFYDPIKRMRPLAAKRYKIDKQIELFTSAKGIFGHVMAMETRNKKHPGTYYLLSKFFWWKSHGDSTPELQRLVVRILIATCSASGCERNWSIFEQVHTKRRNRLSQQRLNALVYVKYNLQLNERFTKSNWSIFEQVHTKIRNRLLQQRLNALVYVKYNLQLNERFIKSKEQGDSYDPICLSDVESDDEWINEKDGASLQPNPTWMDAHDFFHITEAEANKKKRKRGPRNLSTMKLAQAKWNNNGKEARLVEENEIEEVEEDETEEETCVEEMSETEIQVESDNEWLSDDGYEMGDH
ncbi:hypothetical protein MKX03_019211 [Papaver bracteatum]|nr:hypothetical protein MKX03_019211 [Papaver bracteatum]